MNKKKAAIKTVIKVISVLLAIVIVILAAFGISYAEQATRDKTMLERTDTKFYTDETGNRIANIPYDEYLNQLERPDGALDVEELSQENSGEENAAAIQSAIDSLSEQGGGTVYIPEGEYKISTIMLKDNITLFVSYGAELISLSCDENNASQSPLQNGVICADNAKNIAITGGGTINGMGETYTNEPAESEPFYALKYFNTYTRVIEARKRIREAKEYPRTHILNLYNCENVNISGVRLKDAANWTFIVNDCENVNISDLIIDNSMHVANSDGIDIKGGDNIKINHCFIATGDDGIVLKPIEAPISNVYVSDCIISSYANCFKIGTETQMDVSVINVNNCYFFMPNGITGGYSGIAVESCDGSNVSDINISDITMEGVSSPFLIWLGNRLNYDKSAVGSINGVTIKNVTATDTEMPSAVTGCIDDDGVTHYVENVTVENVNVTYRDTQEDLHIRDKIGEYTMSGYPDITRVSHVYFISHELSKYWDLPCYSLALKHVKNIEYSTYSTTPRTCNEREELYIDDVI